MSLMWVCVCLDCICYAYGYIGILYAYRHMACVLWLFVDRMVVASHQIVAGTMQYERAAEPASDDLHNETFLVIGKLLLVKYFEKRHCKHTNPY